VIKESTLSAILVAPPEWLRRCMDIMIPRKYKRRK
jgi:hypothetical protein